MPDSFEILKQVMTHTKRSKMPGVPRQMVKDGIKRSMERSMSEGIDYVGRENPSANYVPKEGLKNNLDSKAISNVIVRGVTQLLRSFGG